MYKPLLSTAVTICLLCAFSTSAADTTNTENVLDFLKKTPSTKYELGKLKMELGAYIITQEVKGQKLKGTSFEFIGIGVKEDINSLNLLVKLKGKAKDLSEKQCEEFKTFFKDNTKLNEGNSDLWQGLTEPQYEELKSILGMSVELTSSENESFKLSC